jgi:hypothetical protein
MSLTTGKRLSRQQWDELPMPDGVIAPAVEVMTAAQEQPVFDNGAPVFEWSPGIAIADEDKTPIIVDLDEQGADDRGVAEGIDINKDENEEDQEAEDDVTNENDAEDDGSKGDEGENPPEPGEAFTLPDTLLKMEGDSVDIMCGVCEHYKAFVKYENGKKVLYLQLLKALLHGCVKSALLWYEIFTGGTLQQMGFELNPYDPCVANKMVDNK